MERDAQRCPRQRGRKAFASLFSTLRVKTFRGPSSARSLPSLLRTCQNIFPISPLFLSLSLPLSFYITPLLRVINYSIIGDRKRSTYPVGLANKSGGEIFDYFLGFCKQNSYCIAGSRALARVSMKILTQNKFDENYKSCDKRRKVKFGRGIFFEKSSKKRREREKRYRKLGRGSCYSASSNRAASQCSTGTARFVD